MDSAQFSDILRDPCPVGNLKQNHLPIAHSRKQCFKFVAMQLEGSVACPSISSSLLAKIMAGEHFSNCNGHKNTKTIKGKRRLGQIAYKAHIYC